MKPFLFLCLICMPFALAAQTTTPFFWLYAGTGSYSPQFSDLFSFTANSAALVQVKEAGAGIYSETPYLLRELAFYTGAIALPFKTGTGGLRISFSGNKDAYQLSQYAMAYGRRLSDKIDLGVQFNYYHLSIPAYGKASSISADIGVMVRITGTLRAGFHAGNLSGAGQALAGMPAAVYNMGLGYEASGQVLLKIDLRSEEGTPVQVAPGIQYNLNSLVRLRAAMLLSTGSLVAGTGLRWKNVQIDLNAAWHQQLGVTPGLLVVFNKTGRR